MGTAINNAFPAGDESDASGTEEWDIGPPGKKTSCSFEVEDPVAPCQDNVFIMRRAISNGDIRTVEQLLDNGMNVETGLGCYWTPLMCAVSFTNHDIAQLLLDRGASANSSKDHCTVLMASITASGSEDKIARCVELLLSRNADPNMVDRCQMTCLMMAAREGYSKVINLLVSHGAKINAQDNSGYTALSVAVQYGREGAVLKLLQLGAEKNIKTVTGKSPADLAAAFKHTQIGRILASSSHTSIVQAFSSMEDTLSMFFKTNSEPLPSKESVTKLDELELLLHGLDLGHLTDIMTENDVTWNDLLTMEKDDLEKIGVTDPEDQQKVLSTLQQMYPDKVDLETISQLELANCGSEELHNFLISVRQQCCYLTESIQDVIKRFPRNASQLVFSLDPNKDAQVVCNQLLLQTKDLQMEVACLRNLLCQMDDAGDNCQPPQLVSHSNRRMRSLTRVALCALGATLLFLLHKNGGGRVYLQTLRNVC